MSRFYNFNSVFVDDSLGVKSVKIPKNRRFWTISWKHLFTGTSHLRATDCGQWPTESTRRPHRP